MGGAAGEHKHRPVNESGSSLSGILPVLHRGQEVPQPAPADAVELTVKFIEEHQRDSALGAVDGLVQGFKEVLGVAALGQVDGGYLENAAGGGNLPDTEGLAGTGIAEHGNGQGLNLLPGLSAVATQNVLIHQRLDGVVVLHFTFVHSGQIVVAAHRHIFEQGVRALHHDFLRHPQVSARFGFAVFIQNAEGGGACHQRLETPLRHGHGGDLSLFPAGMQIFEDGIQVRVLA